jgi:serine/threonine-protein kinase
MRLTLTVTSGPLEGRVFTLTRHETLLAGRSRHAHVQLPVADRYCSRLHFLVELSPPACRLVDLGSNNGTFVNGQRVPRADLSDGDLVRAGQTTLRVGIGAEGTTLPDDDVPAPPVPLGPPGPQRALPDWLAPLPLSHVCVGCEATLDERERSAGEQGAVLCRVCQERVRLAGQPLPGYQLVRVLGKGGTGTVHLALRGDRAVAIKVIVPAVRASTSKVERFLREARILCQLHHPNIVDFYETGEAEELLYFVMEYVRGPTAWQLWHSSGNNLPVARAVGLVCQALQGLEHAHASGFVHRDVKPSNLLVTQEGGRDLVKLADFGLARVYQSSELSGLTVTGDVGGTPRYMAPEQITRFRDVMPSTDQYGAAATLYFLLTGQAPFEADTMEELFNKVLHEGVVPAHRRRPGVPQRLSRVLQRALARSPEDRFPDVGALRRELARFAGTAVER